MKHSNLLLELLFIAIVIVLGCSSGTGGGPLTGFSTSACKKDTGQALMNGGYTAAHQPLTTGTSAYDGLNCISWDGSGSTLELDLINFRGGCAIEWQGKAEKGEGNSLVLYANHEPTVPGDENSCMYAACGWCIYDWAYEVQGPDTSKDCPIEIVSGLPCDKSYDKYDYTLPLASKKSGVVCRYIDPYVLEWVTMGSGTGKLHTPCRDAGSADGRCNAGLACTRMTSNSICLKTCTQDSDCPLDGLLKCTDGLCRLKETW